MAARLALALPRRRHGRAPLAEAASRRRRFAAGAPSNGASAGANKAALMRRLREPQLSLRAIDETTKALWRHGFMNDPMNFTTVISAWARRQRWREAIACMEEMPRVGLDVDVIACGATISACARAGQWEAAVGLFDRLQLSKQRPNAVVVNAVSSACSKGRRWELALGFFDAMHLSRVNPDAVSQNVLLTACERGSQWRHALQMLMGMEAPDLVAYNATLTACERGSRWRHAVDLLSVMRRSGPRPDVVSLNAITLAMKRASAWVKALALVDAFQMDGISPDSDTLRGLMGACRRGERWDLSLQLFEALRTLGGGDPPDAGAFGAAIRAHGATQNWQGALELLAEMWEAGVTLRPATYREAVLTCAGARQWEWCILLFEEMRQDGFEPTPALREEVQRLQREAQGAGDSDSIPEPEVRV